MNFSKNQEKREKVILSEHFQAELWTFFMDLLLSSSHS